MTELVNRNSVDAEIDVALTVLSPVFVSEIKSEPVRSAVQIFANSKSAGGFSGIGN